MEGMLLVPRGLKIYKNFDITTLDSEDMLPQDLHGNKVIAIGGEDEGVWKTEEMLWHHDRAYHPDCHNTVGLYCIAAEAGSSPTYFIDMVTAYEDAPQYIKNKLRTEKGTHSVRKYMEQATYPHTFKDKKEERKWRVLSKAEHPLVQENQYGTFFFYSPAYTETDWEPWLKEHCLQEKYIYTHYWEPGDMLIYDNKSILHRRDRTHPDIDRRHLRYALR